MATDSQKSTTGRTVKNDPAAPADANPEPHTGEKRAAARTKASRAKRAKPPAQRPRKAAQQPKRKPYQMEITALADTTAELPPPWRKKAIRIVAAIIELFKRTWRELRQRPIPAPNDGAEASSSADDSDPAMQS